MAKKKNKDNTNNTKTTKVSWAFIAVVVGGLAYLAAYLFSKVKAFAPLADAGRWIAGICGAIAWIIVFCIGWKRIRQNNVWMVIVYIVCMLLIIVFAILPFVS